MRTTPLASLEDIRTSMNEQSIDLNKLKEMSAVEFRIRVFAGSTGQTIIKGHLGERFVNNDSINTLAETLFPENSKEAI